MVDCLFLQLQRSLLALSLKHRFPLSYFSVFMWTGEKMTETERVNGLPNKQQVTLSRRSCVSMWLNFQLTLYTWPVPVSDEYLHLRGRFLASFQLRFSCLSADRSVAKQRRQVSVTAAACRVCPLSLVDAVWMELLRMAIFSQVRQL